MNTIGPDASTLVGAALLRWFEELSDTGIFTTDTSLTIRTWNQWLAAQTGILAADAIGRPLFDLYPSLVERGLDQYYRDALAGEVRVLSERFHRYLIPISRNFHAAGVTDMAQSARIAPLTIDGQVLGTITVIDDVTERVVSDRELRTQIAASEHARAVAEEASRLKDDFLATLSHEIRTPLNAVLGWARMLRTQPKLRSKQHALEVIERNAATQLRLVEDLLDMARVISGKLRLEINPVQIAEVAQAAVDVVSPAADSKRIAIHTSFASDAPLVNGDAERLQQVIWNLLSNAVKFTEPDGRIEVEIATSGDSVLLRVRDSGVGITSDFLPFVFDRFRQADASASRRHGGLGLGLALVRQIVELHGGTVAVESLGHEKGTTFTIKLPAASAPSKGTELRESSARTPVTLKGVSVLLVDDNADGRELLTTALREYGARVKAVASATAALDALADENFMPDVLVSDVGMPGLNGYDLIRQLRSSTSPRWRQLPALAVTAYANPEDRIRALVAGYQAHLPKPIDPAVVATSISTLVAPDSNKIARRK